MTSDPATTDRLRALKDELEWIIGGRQAGQHVTIRASILNRWLDELSAVLSAQPQPILGANPSLSGQEWLKDVLSAQPMQEITACGLTREALHKGVAMLDQEAVIDRCAHVRKGATPRGVQCRDCRREWVGEEGERVWKAMSAFDSDAAQPSASLVQSTTALELFRHVQRGHVQTTRKRYIECSCGATFWYPDVQPSASPLRGHTKS